MIVSNPFDCRLFPARGDWDRYWAHRNRFRQEQQIRELLCRSNWYPLPYPFLAMQEARSYALDPSKFKRDTIRNDLEELKAHDSAPGRDSEDDDVDVDDEPVSYKTTSTTPPATSTATESLKKKWSRQAEELSRESPSPAIGPPAAATAPVALQPPAAHSHPHITSHAAAASDKGEPNLFPLHPLFEKGLLTNLKPNGLLARAT